MKKFADVFRCFDRIPACAEQTDGRTDKRISRDSIVRDMHSFVR